MKISAVVSTKNRREELKRLLASLRTQTRPPDELIVIDADCAADVEKLVSGAGIPGVPARYFPFPSSLTQARNKGVQESSGDVVVFLDDDLILEPDFLKEIARPIAQRPEIAGVTGDITNHSRNSGGLKRFLQYLLGLPYDGDGRFRLSGAPTTTCGLKEARDVEFVPGGITAWRREVFKEFSFDENLPGLGINEDVDFSYRVSRLWKNHYAPSARAAHERPSLAREATAAYLRMELASQAYLYRKNQPKDFPHAAAFLWHCLGVLVRFAFRRFART